MNTMNRIKQLNIRLSENEVDILYRNAARAGLTHSAYLRMLLRGWVPRSAPPAQIQSIINQLGDICSDLQNSGMEVESVRLAKVLLRLQKALTVPDKNSDMATTKIWPVRGWLGQVVDYTMDQTKPVIPSISRQRQNRHRHAVGDVMAYATPPVGNRARNTMSRVSTACQRLRD
jgi:hypothetical protein